MENLVLHFEVKICTYFNKCFKLLALVHSDTYVNDYLYNSLTNYWDFHNGQQLQILISCVNPLRFIHKALAVFLI